MTEPKMPVDRNGEPFAGTLLELKRHNDKLRQRHSRANRGRVDLPLPAGTNAALQRVLQAADFEDARELLTVQIHKLDQLREQDPAAFDMWVRFTVSAGDLSKYFSRLGPAS